MTFYHSQKMSAAAVYNRHDGQFVGMIRLVALETGSPRVLREGIEKSDEAPLVDLRWHAALDFKQQQFHYAMRQAVPAALSTIFNKLTNANEEMLAQDDDHVLIKCDPWFAPEPTLEQALKKSAHKAA